MARLFIPDFYVEELLDVDWTFLKDQGVRHVYLDIDNTLELQGARQAGPRTQAICQSVLDAGLGLSVLSNAATERARTFCAPLGLDYLGQAAKPLTGRMRQDMEAKGLKPQELALVGDQIFTDLWCARALGCQAVLVHRLGGQEGFWLRVKRKLEKFLLLLGQDPRKAPRLPLKTKPIA